MWSWLKPVPFFLLRFIYFGSRLSITLASGKVVPELKMVVWGWGGVRLFTQLHSPLWSVCSFRQRGSGRNMPAIQCVAYAYLHVEQITHINDIKYRDNLCLHASFNMDIRSTVICVRKKSMSLIKFAEHVRKQSLHLSPITRFASQIFILHWNIRFAALVTVL